MRGHADAWHCRTPTPAVALSPRHSGLPRQSGARWVSLRVSHNSATWARGEPAHQVDRRRGRGTMTDLIEHADTEPADGADTVTEGAPGGPVAPKRRGVAGAMRRPRSVIVAICVVVVAGTLGGVAM